MRISRSIKISCAPIFFVCFFTYLKVTAQTENVQPKFKQVIVYIPKIKAKKMLQKNNDLVIDSLKNTIAAYDSMYRSLLLQAEIKDSVMNRSNQKINVWQAAINDLQLRVSNYETLNLQTQKNNRILILFNSVVCLLLFLMLIRYLLNMRKKKSGSFQKKDERAAAPGMSNPDVLPQQNKIAYKLEQLERLGKLRNLGVLTEGEFILQKQIILEN